MDSINWTWSIWFDPLEAIYWIRPIGLDLIHWIGVDTLDWIRPIRLHSNHWIGFYSLDWIRFIRLTNCIRTIGFGSMLFFFSSHEILLRKIDQVNRYVSNVQYSCSYTTMHPYLLYILPCMIIHCCVHGKNCQHWPQVCSGYPSGSKIVVL